MSEILPNSSEGIYILSLSRNGPSWDKNCPYFRSLSIAPSQVGRSVGEVQFTHNITTWAGMYLINNRHSYNILVGIENWLGTPHREWSPSMRRESSIIWRIVLSVVEEWEQELQQLTYTFIFLHWSCKSQSINNSCNIRYQDHYPSFCRSIISWKWWLLAVTAEKKLK